MTKRTYDHNLDNVFVKMDGRILWDGDEIGNVMKVDAAFHKMGKWRAEIGDPSNPTAWPPFRASYARTKAAAVADVLEGVEVPE